MEPGITVFVPLYNEDEVLRDNTERILRHLGRFDLPFEVILGSNGSTDGTVEVGRDLARSSDKVVFFHILRRGPGRAFREALRRARYEYFICLDADLSFEMKFLDRTVEALADHDAVVGSKWLGTQRRSLVRVAASECFIILTNVLLRMPWRDYSIGAKAYRTSAIRPFIRMIDPHTFYTQELLYRLRGAGGRIAEIPVRCEDMRPSRFNLLHEGFYRYGKLFGLWMRSLDKFRPEAGGGRP